MDSVISFDGNPGVSASTTTSDAVVTVTRATDCIGALITVETNDIRFDFGQNPSQAGAGHLLVAGAGLKLSSGAAVGKFRFINKTNGSQAVVKITQFIKA